ncbi:hypothetical protein MMC25_001748 [Agyrium rufum]|nr:hypothetical protein [Agyrium rufum]
MFSSALKSFSSNIATNYSISSQPSSFAGAWKVFDGKNKKTAKVVSIFVFDRKSLDPPGGSLRSKSEGAALRKIHDEVVERLKKEASSLARLRHPNVLQLEEPVEDTRSGGLMFATEPIIASLGSLLKDEDDASSSGGGRSTRSRADGPSGKSADFEVDELEIQKGLLQVSKALEFLHESAGLVHGNLTPDAIYINQKSDWKISALGFSGPPDTSSTNTSSAPIALSEILYYDPRLPRNVQLNIDYTSPDFVMDSNISSGADMFSLGLIILALYNSPHESPLHTNYNLNTYKKLFSSSSTVPATSNNFLASKPLPKDLLNGTLPRLITRRPAQRLSAREFQQSQFFDNILVSTLRFLDSLPAKTPNEKSQFLRGLPRILDQFPKSVLEKKVLSALLEETKDKELLALIMQNVFKIVKIMPSAQRAFTDKILPRLRETFIHGANKGATERDIAKEAGLIVVLENIGLIAENCNGKEFKDDILLIIQSGLDSHTHSLVDKSLSCLPVILLTLDFSTIKNEVFPVVATVFTKTSSLAIKIRGLEAFGLLCGAPTSSMEGATTINGATQANNSAILDKYTIQEKIIPLMKGIKTKEPAVMMAALAVFKQVSQIADIDFLATDVLPILWSFSLGPLLNLEQFSEYMNLIKSTSRRIEQEQTKKLRELSSSSTSKNFGNARTNDLMSMGAAQDPFGSTKIGEDDFERLVLGKASNGAPSNSNNLMTPSSAIRPTTQQRTLSSHQPTSPAFTNLQAQQSPAFSQRAITPDQTLSSFATLNPAKTQSLFPPTNNINSNTFSNPTWSATQPMQSSKPSFAAPTTAATSSWSSYSQPAQPSPNMGTQTWGISSPPTSQSTTQNSYLPSPISAGWSIPPPPSSSTSSWGNGTQGAQNGNTVNRMGGGLGGRNNAGTTNRFFNIASPPASSATKGGSKTGLDKFESLI